MSTPIVRRSRSDASVGVMRHPLRDDLMVPVLRVNAIDGKAFQFELTVDDLHNLRADLDALLCADEETVSGWWAALADGSDGRPQSPLSHAPAGMGQ
jgi:hypothetical protein